MAQKKTVSRWAPVNGYITIEVTSALLDKQWDCPVCNLTLEEGLKVSIEEATGIAVHLVDCRQKLMMQRVRESGEDDIGTLMRRFGRSAYTVLRWLSEVKHGRE